MCHFRIGQKVVCIADASDKVGDLGFPMFNKGDILTISELEMTDADGWLSEPHLFLYFVERDPRHGGHHSGFRPLVEKKTDISIFKAMLNPSKQGVPA